MKNKLALIAFGGNAMLSAGQEGTADEQYRNAQKAARLMVNIIKQGYELIIVHGNGPQVGNVLLQMEAASDILPPFPLDVCGAMTEGSMGYLLARAIQNELREQSIDKEVVTLLTQVIVEPQDPAFDKPTKPIGPFYDASRAKRLQEENKWDMIEDAGRGFRRVVPSPRPVEVVPGKAIRAMIEKGIVVIAAGGGGIPVIADARGFLEGVEAVIDKDFASSLIAGEAGVDLFIILTGVDRVVENFGTKNARPIEIMDVEQAREMLQKGQFPPGSMGPKIAASIEYIERGGKEVVITSAEQLESALIDGSGTRIIGHLSTNQGDESGG